MGLKVYGLPLSANAVRVVAALNEKGLDFEYITIDLGTGAQLTPEFLAINPFGQVPALADGDIKLWESRAINKYIATRYKDTGLDLLPTNNPVEHAAIEVWLEVESKQFDSPIAKVVFELLIKPILGRDPDQAFAETEAANLSKVLDVYDVHLSKNKYLGGSHFSLADVNHMPCTYYLMKTSKAELVNSRPHLKAWWENVSARPAWKKTVEHIPV